MKWLAYITKISLSKLVRGLVLLAVLKTGLVGMVSWQMLDVPQTGQQAARKSVVKAPAAPLVQLAAPATAHAQDTMADTATAPEQNSGSSAAERASMQRQKETLARRERELKALETKITKAVADLERKRALVERMLEDAKAVKTKKDRHLVDVFSNMKPKQAAQVLQTMNEQQAIKILAGMNGRRAGELLTFVEPQKAARLAERLTRLQIPLE